MVFGQCLSVLRTKRNDQTPSKYLLCTLVGIFILVTMVRRNALTFGRYSSQHLC